MSSKADSFLPTSYGWQSDIFAVPTITGDKHYNCQHLWPALSYTTYVWIRFVCTYRNVSPAEVGIQSEQNSDVDNIYNVIYLQLYGMGIRIKGAMKLIAIKS